MYLLPRSARSHQLVALILVLAYAALCAASITSHGDRKECKALKMRAVSLLREAARCSLRAERGHSDTAEVYADAARARIYVSAVDRLLSSADVARLTGVSIDELRSYVDSQLNNSRAALAGDFTYDGGYSSCKAVPAFVRQR